MDSSIDETAVRFDKATLQNLATSISKAIYIRRSFWILDSARKMRTLDVVKAYDKIISLEDTKKGLYQNRAALSVAEMV